MKLSKPRKKIKNRALSKIPFTVRGYQYYYGAIILVVLLIGLRQLFS